MADLIDRKTLADEVRSLRMTITGLRNGKGALALYAKEYRDAVLQIIDDQATVKPEHKSADEMFRELGYERAYSGVYRRFCPSGSVYEITVDTKETVSKTYWCERYGRMHYELEAKEIPAIAQLIREMEVSDRAQTMGK